MDGLENDDCISEFIAEMTKEIREEYPQANCTDALLKKISLKSIDMGWKCCKEAIMDLISRSVS